MVVPSYYYKFLFNLQSKYEFLRHQSHLDTLHPIDNDKEYTDIKNHWLQYSLEIKDLINEFNDHFSEYSPLLRREVQQEIHKCLELIDNTLGKIEMGKDPVSDGAPSDRVGAPGEYSGNGGYSGAGRGEYCGGASGGYSGAGRGEYCGGASGGYSGGARGGYSGGVNGGYSGGVNGGYSGGSRGGGYAGGARGGYSGAGRGGYSGGANGGYSGGARGGYSGGAGGYSGGSRGGYSGGAGGYSGSNGGYAGGYPG